MDLKSLLRLCHKANKYRVSNKCMFSTSVTYAARNRQIQYFSSPEAAKAQKQIRKERDTLDVYGALRKRRKYDFPLGDDQRSSWDHRMWYDPYFQKWVDRFPDPCRKEFSIYEMNKRKIIHEQKSVEGKLHLLLDQDKKRKYIIESLNMDFSRNASYFYQSITHTKFVHGMPYNIHTSPIENDEIENFESMLTNALQLETKYNLTTSSEKSRKKRADRILSNILQFLMDSASSNSDFEECEIDNDPQNAMFWQNGRGFHKYSLSPDVPITYQSHDEPMYQIRTKNPLPEFTPWMEDFMLTGEIPNLESTPHVYDISRESYRNIISPGFRFKGGDVSLNYQEALEEDMILKLPPPLTDNCLNGHTQIISLPERFSREWYEENQYHCNITDQLEEQIKAHGIVSGWTWSAALAHYKGHWWDDDVTKPLCVQTIISDGEYVAFFCYQLNTVAIDPENLDMNTHQKRNVCYGTPFMKLYNKVEGTDDIELYRDATTLLLKFIHNNSNRKINREEAIQHNSTLEVQEWDSENPQIELQKPKHVREKEIALAIAEEDTIEKNKGFGSKILDWVKS